MPPARRSGAALAVTLATAATGSLLTMASTPASAATACASPVYKRQFFANTTFSGTPKKTDCDSAIDQNWGSGAPASGLPKDKFGVRWTVTRDFGSGGPFSFAAAAQDGIRVYLDGKLKIDLWKNVSTTVKKTVNITIPKGKHTLRVDFINITGKANVKFAYTPRTSATVDKVKPLAPTGTKATYDTATGKATLTWSKNREMDLAGYRVHRKLKGSTTWKKLATSTSTSYSDTTLPVTGESYVYEVRAYDKAGHESVGSADQNVTTVDTTAPAAPTGVEDNWAIGNVTTARLHWDSNTESDLAGYRVYRSTTYPVAVTDANLVSGPTPISGSAYADDMPTTGETYYYVATAVDAHGNASPPSGTAEYTSKDIDTTAPLYAPDDVTAVDGQHGVTLNWSWSADADDDISSFYVFRDGAGIGPPSGESYVDTEIERSTTHTYWVRAVDRHGNLGPVSNSVTVDHVGDYTAPAAVTGLTATAMGNGVRLDWDDSPAEDVADYRIHRGVYTDGAWAYTDITDSLPFGSIWSQNRDVNLPDGENLRYVVVAVDKDGNALDLDSAAGVKVTELDIVPTETYANESASGSMTVIAEDIAQGPSLRVNYVRELDPHGTATGFNVYRWDGSTGTYALLTDTPVGLSDSYHDNTAPAATTVFYKVTAAYADGTEAETVGDHVFRTGTSA
ncbi:fibronectin type III domain-containing protein [Streptomyces sp. NPDC058470]|uniref:fibronectin type III domain-containing protein n=1 Tax=Streptomyces sp. NPDC058470 TaxID=3346515 RepID=UPI00364F21E2